MMNFKIYRRMTQQRRLNYWRAQWRDDLEVSQEELESNAHKHGVQAKSILRDDDTQPGDETENEDQS